MLTIEACKKVLNNGNRKYSDEEVKEIREFLYAIAEFQIEMENIIISKYNQNDQGKCNYLCSCIK
jgi:hypothetical protein